MIMGSNAAENHPMSLGG